MKKKTSRSKRLLLSCAAVLLLSACAGPKSLHRRALQRQLNKVLSASKVFEKSASGFILCDAQSGNVLCDFHANRLFTPASNTKILTLHAALCLLPDTLPAFEWIADGDTLRFRGMGDPSFLHPRFEAWAGVGAEFLSRIPLALALCSPSQSPDRYGSGWAWDDYMYPFQCERGAFPLYGHMLQVSEKRGLRERVRVYPPFFQDSFAAEPSLPVRRPRRDEFRNRWRYHPDSAWYAFQTPFRADGLAAPLLADTLQRPVAQTSAPTNASAWRRFYACPRDTLLRLMMYESDNFIAEQLLIAASMAHCGTPDPECAIRYLRDTLWSARSDRPRWIDGSGLSRYNLISPRYLSETLVELWRALPTDSLFRFFAAGGRRGTIADRYAGPEGEPFVWAKTGSMSGVHCLSGYIRTKRKKILVFSFMHNNFTGPNAPWKDEMERVLRWIYAHH
ncbi:MAG: D-alanyl-D-alanine carboxypeptidase/D-alanyl-D-alanine-endopeptidase [Saprospiraceae bacterium]